MRNHDCILLYNILVLDLRAAALWIEMSSPYAATRLGTSGIMGACDWN